MIYREGCGRKWPLLRLPGGTKENHLYDFSRDSEVTSRVSNRTLGAECKLEAVALLVEALRYKPEGRWFDAQWGQQNFSVT
jgi:hypothetical protein